MIILFFNEMISAAFTYKTPLRGKIDVNTYNHHETFISPHHYEMSTTKGHSMVVYEGVKKPTLSVVEGDILWV
jgi:hypothetical protein